MLLGLLLGYRVVKMQTCLKLLHQELFFLLIVRANIYKLKIWVYNILLKYDILLKELIAKKNGRIAPLFLIFEQEI